MKHLEIKFIYLTVGFLLGALIVTANPLVQHWPELETRLELD